MTQSLLDDVISTFGVLPEDERKALEQEADSIVGDAKWLPNPGPQTDAYFCEADVLLYGGQGGGGKALALDTEIPTPSGWKRMGDIKVGDQVFDENGKPCNVITVSPVMINHKCYVVEFSDGTEVVADADHRWLTMTQYERDATLTRTDEWRAKRRAGRPSRAKEKSKKPGVSKSITRINQEREYTYLPPPSGSVRTTEEILNTLTYGRRGGKNHSVELCKPIELPDADLPVDPYVLGAWLGDGTSAAGEITTADQEILEQLHDAGYETVSRERYSRYAHGVYGLKAALRDIGVLANKHIPPLYQRASVAQRVALLQGLMDTDGHAMADKGAGEFTTTNETLAFDVAELVQSLGCKVRIAVGRATIKGKDCGPKYRLQFYANFPMFRLERKLKRQKLDGFRPTVFRRYIVDVRPVDSVPVQCIGVDSDSHLYLATRSFIPTHNTDLGLGLAFTAFKRSLILRRQYVNLTGILDRAIKINGSRRGVNLSPPPSIRTDDDRLVQFAGCAKLGDEQDWQGVPFGLKYFDEATQFLELQIRFHLGWLRDAEEGKRTRAILGTNPPVSADGDFVIGMFRPWLDVTHHNPAKAGELRWFISDGADDIEIDEADLGRDQYGRRPIQRDGRTFYAKSRTFIPAALADNPFLINTNYQAELDALPEPIRSAVRDGNFMAARADADFQVIPTQWIIEAQARWKPNGGDDWAMTAMGFDPAGGGADAAELVWRKGPWFSDIITVQGEETADGSSAAATIVKHRRDNAPVVIDVGGGYGGAVSLRLKDNDIPFQPFNGATATGAKTIDRTLGFQNLRAEAWWRMREALDPDREGGSHIALPPSPELRADLAAPTFTVGPRGILLEPKDKLRERLGRSPGKGDAVVMAHLYGPEFTAKKVRHRADPSSRPAYASVGYGDIKRRRRKR